MDCHQHHHHIADSTMELLAVGERLSPGLQIARRTANSPQGNHEQQPQQAGPSMEVSGDEVSGHLESVEACSCDVSSKCKCNYTDDRCHHLVTGCLVTLQGCGSLCPSKKQVLLPPATLSDEYPDEGKCCDWVQQQHCGADGVHESCCGCDALSSLYELLA